MEWILSLTKERRLEAVPYLRIPGVNLSGWDAHFFPVADLQHNKYQSIIHEVVVPGAGGAGGGDWPDRQQVPQLADYLFILICSKQHSLDNK